MIRLESINAIDSNTLKRMLKDDYYAYKRISPILINKLFAVYELIQKYGTILSAIEREENTDDNKKAKLYLDEFFKAMSYELLSLSLWLKDFKNLHPDDLILSEVINRSMK